VEKALNTITARTLVVGIDSDILFPIHEQQFLAKHISNAHLETMTSLYGHDGFLVEVEQLNQYIKRFFSEDLVSVVTKYK
ncbi:MAG TPA: hypothetical protein VL443_16240, partial [Cyclobacteriaceae bacterium]|nr:hypothetical protein [Cyclobacteriaceae bacterium]